MKKRKMTHTITVSLVEDDPGVRTNLASLIDSAPGFKCHAAYPDGPSALAGIPGDRPDVVLMDINLPGGESGIACTTQLKKLLPRLQIIMLTVYKDHDLIFQALQAGACGYLLKRSSREEILRAIAPGATNQWHCVRLVNTGGGASEAWKLSGAGNGIKFNLTNGNLRAEQEIYFQIDPAAVSRGAQTRGINISGDSGASDTVVIKFKCSNFQTVKLLQSLPGSG